MDLEFNLAHPAFLVDNTIGTTTTWAVNFNGPVRHHPNYDLASTILRHAYGTVTGVATDNSSISIVKDHEVYPVRPPARAHRQPPDPPDPGGRHQRHPLL